MDCPGGQPAVCGSVDDRLRPVGDIASGKDTWRSRCQRRSVNQQAAPGGSANTRPLRQEGWIRSLADRDEHDINRQIELRAKNRHRLAPSLLVRLAERHALAAHASYIACR